MPTKTIGEVIKRARERRGLTADEVAAKCNVARSSVYQWEASSYILPKNFKALAPVLGVTEKYLIRRNGERHQAAA